MKMLLKIVGGILVCLATDPVAMEGVLQVRAKKYPQLKIPADATIHVFHVFG